MIDSKLEMKKRLLEEMISELDEKEGDKLRPKSIELEVGEDEPSDPSSMRKTVEKGPDEDEELSDDDLKMLLANMRK